MLAIPVLHELTDQNDRETAITGSAQIELMIVTEGREVDVVNHERAFQIVMFVPRRFEPMVRSLILVEVCSPRGSCRLLRLEVVEATGFLLEYGHVEEWTVSTLDLDLRHGDRFTISWGGVRHDCLVMGHERWQRLEATRPHARSGT
ncbi:MAG: hypothetical protein KDB53_18930 [Planctomycetes bacterium]|nr:hypothetical protein [Planctomycetota bacterium]